MLPGLPAFYRGIIIHQGAVYPLVDVRKLFGIAGDDEQGPDQALLFSRSDHAIAIVAEAVEAFVQVEAATIGARSAVQPAPTAVRGRTADGIVVLDVHLLMADARLVIDERAPVPDQNV